MHMLESWPRWSAQGYEGSRYPQTAPLCCLVPAQCSGLLLGKVGGNERSMRLGRLTGGFVPFLKCL